MFEDTLLESSVKAAPVLRGIHWLISIVIGAAVFLSLFFILPTISANETKIIAAQSAIVAAVATAFAVILCYVLADCKRHGFNRAVWFIIVLLLNLVGFIIYLVYSAAKTGDWQRATLPIAYLFEALIIGVMVLVPLIYTEALPKAQLMTFLAAPPPPPPPPPPPAAAPPPRVFHRVSEEDLMRAPTVIPKTIAKVKDEAPPPGTVGVVGGVYGGVPGGSWGGVLGGVIGGSLSAVAPPPPPPKPVAPKRVRVGGQVESAKLIFRPTPEYPPLAKMARIQGVVRLDAVISKDGTIQDLKVISGHPLLVKAALDAVSRWRYQPTLLNGESVEVATEIDVNFTLSE
ncbi:MAG: energy transducer TonB [Terriglobia bacterium]